MKKILLLITMSIMLFTITSCTYDESYKLAATYNFEERQCCITNISKATDYKDLNVTVVINGKDNFAKEITYEIGDLESSETYTGDLSYISEDIEVSGVYVKSYEYYQNDFFFVIGCVVIVVLLILLFVGELFAI